MINAIKQLNLFLVDNKNKVDLHLQYMLFLSFVCFVFVFNSESSILYKINLALLFISVILNLTFRFFYIKSETDRKQPESQISSAERDFGAQVSSLERQFRKTASETLNSYLDQFAHDIEGRIETQLGERIDRQIEDGVLQKISHTLAQRATDYAWRHALKQNTSDRYNIARNRIDELAQKAERSATFFRWMGVILALAGFGIAVAKWVHYWNSGLLDQPLDNTPLWAHLAATGTVVILSEVLALIMFRYHSRSLEQMRSFANEVSTLNLRFAAALMVVEIGSKKDVMTLAQELGRVERNFVLKKGEHTLETLQSAGEDALVTALMDRLPTAIADRIKKPNDQGSSGSP